MSAFALGGRRTAGESGGGAPRSSGSSLLVVIALVMGARFVGETPSKHAKAAGPRRPPPWPRRPARARGRCRSSSAASTSRVRSPRCRGSSASTSATSATASTRSSSTSRTRAARSGSGRRASRSRRTVGATRPFYNPKALVALAHRNGIYMIGRVVCFQDPKLAQSRPDLAIQRRDGSVWTTSAGLGWVNPYDRRVWDYCVSVAEAAADAGFDQIMFDYVRFPSDGDIASAVYPGQDERPAGARHRRLRRVCEEAARAAAASASRPRSSGSRPRATSASARCRASSRSTPTASPR